MLLAFFDIRSKEGLELAHASLRDDTESLLQQGTQEVQLGDDLVHRQCVRKEQEMSAAPADAASLDNVQITDGVDETHASDLSRGEIRRHWDAEAEASGEGIELSSEGSPTTHIEDSTPCHFPQEVVHRKHKGLPDTIVPAVSWNWRAIPFRPGSHTAHAVEAIQHTLAAQQHLVVEIKREWAFQTRLILSVGEQTSELPQLSLQVEFPTVSVGGRPRTLP